MATSNDKVSLYHVDTKAGTYLVLFVAPRAVLNAFDIYVELGFATSHGREGWDLFNTLCCAKDGYTILENIEDQTLPRWLHISLKYQQSNPACGYAQL